METASCCNLPATFSIHPLLVCCANLTAGHTKMKFLMRRHASVPLPSGNFPMISDDLVNSYHLLLCALDLVLTNALLCNARKELLNPDFRGSNLLLRECLSFHLRFHAPLQGEP